MNYKRMEVMLGDLSENFDRHVALSQDTYYYAIPSVDGAGSLELRMYSQGGNVELEVLAFALNGEKVQCAVSVDGEATQKREGAVSIAPLALARGWRTVAISVSGISASRVRITGSISSVSVLSE